MTGVGSGVRVGAALAACAGLALALAAFGAMAPRAAAAAAADPAGASPPHALAATSAIPYGPPFRAELDALFFDPETGAPDPAKLATWRETLERKLRFALVHVARYEELDGGRSAKSARKRAASRDTAVALRHARALLDALAREPDRPRQYALAAELYMVDYATRSYAESLGSIEIPIHLWNIAFDWSLPTGQRAREAASEAGNLVDPATGRFYTPEGLARLVREGVDLSTLDPPAESPFWRALDPAGLDIVDHYLGGGPPVLHGERAVFPGDGATFDFDGMHLTQSKPKIDVTWKDAACRARPAKEQGDCARDYKLKFGMETHADPVANALLAGLGYNADLAEHLRHVRVDLGDFPFEELDKEWTAYFDLQRLHTFIPLRSVLLPGAAGHGRDERGEYVVFQAAVAEYKPKDIDRIGMWPFSEGMASTAREARGLGLFNVWIANADMKDEENNKLSLRTDESGATHTYLTQQDIGHAFGIVLPERPEVFPWEAIESSWWSRLFGFVRGRTELNYMNLQQAGLEWMTTWADAKWMARRIARLSRAQIEAAVALGRYPGGIGDLYVEKLVSRRNQFVRVFGLEDEFPMLPVDRHLTTGDGSVVDGHVVQGRFPDETPNDYLHHHRDVFVPVFQYLGDAAKRALQAGVAAVDEIDPGTFEIRDEWRIAPELVLKVARRVMANPAPEGRFDQYLVQDTLRLGFRAGAGHTGFAEGGFERTVSIAFPVPSRREGIDAPPCLLPLLVWRDAARGALPEHYVLVREHAWRVGARVRSADDIELTGGGDAAHAWVARERTVVDARDAAPIVYRESPRTWETSARAFARLGVLDIPFAKLDRRAGGVEGRAWRLDPAKLATPSARDARASVLDRIVRANDLAEIERIAAGPPARLGARASTRRGWLGFLVASVDAQARAADVAVDGPRGPRAQWSHERRRATSWAFLDNGEERVLEVRASAERAPADGDGDARGAARRGEGGALRAPHVALEWRIDDLLAHSDELDAAYGFLRALAPGRDFVAPGFRAEDWEVSGERDGIWGRMKATADLHLDARALDALCTADADAAFASLGRALGADARAVRHARARLHDADPKRRMVARRAHVSGERERIRALDAALRALARGCASRDDTARVRRIADVLFRATRTHDGTFDPVVVVALLDAAGFDALAASGDALLEARFHKAFEDEHNLPERRDLVGRIGDAALRTRPTDYRLFPRDAEEQWKQLDWARDALAPPPAANAARD